MAGYTSIQDMFDGGGAGQRGDRFEGGGIISGVGNALFSPFGSSNQPAPAMAEIRPQSRPTNPQVQTQSRRQAPARRPQTRGESASAPEVTTTNLDSLQQLLADVKSAGIPIDGPNANIDTQTQLPMGAVTEGMNTARKARQARLLELMPMAQRSATPSRSTPDTNEFSRVAPQMGDGQSMMERFQDELFFNRKQGLMNRSR